MESTKKQCGAIAMMALLLLTLASLTAPLAAKGKTETKPQPQVLGTKGPNGNDPVSYTEVTLSDSRKKEAQAQKLKVAVLMHTSSDFTNSVIAGVQDTVKALDGEVVLVSDAEFDANKQKSDIENALVLGPDIIITLILDGVSGAAALRPAIDAGVKIALLSNLPQGFSHGKDYASIVTDDLFGMGKAIAELMNEQLGGKGKVGLMFHDANYYVTNQRDNAVRSVLERDYPNIEIAASQGIANPDDGETIAAAMLTQHPDLEAIYAPWDSIAEGVLAAARSAGRKDLKVFTMDLGATTVLDMAKGGNMAGVVADLPYELGVTLTNTAVLSKLGEKTPPFVTVPAIKVTRENLEQGWKESLHRDLPPEVQAAMTK
ncbi:MAG: substrate-binding domain-containing protein [Spirochaetota bacterium]